MLIWYENRWTSINVLTKSFVSAFLKNAIQKLHQKLYIIKVSSVLKSDEECSKKNKVQYNIIGKYFNTYKKVHTDAERKFRLQYGHVNIKKNY